MNGKNITTRSMTAQLRQRELEEVISINGSTHVRDAETSSRKAADREQLIRRKSSSKATSAARLNIEAQVKADEELAKILEREEEMLKLKKEMIQNRLALEKARIEEDHSLDNLEENSQLSSEDEQSSHSKVKHWLNSEKSYPKNKYIHEGKHNPNRIEDPQKSNLEILLTRQCVDKELPVFSGDVRDWCFFQKQYESTTRLLQLSQEENMCRLRKCLIDDARRAVEGLLISASSADRILEILKQRFGRSDLIVKDLISAVEQLPSIRNNDFKSFTQFAEKVANLIAMLELMDMTNYLTCPQLLDKLLQKLPYSMQLSWGEKLCGFESSKSSTNLKDFSEWLWKKSNAASYVSISSKSNQNNDKMKYQSQTKDKYKSVFVTSKEKLHPQRSYYCSFCNVDGHNLDICDTFYSLPLDDKWKFISTNKLCFCCLRKSHRISSCYKKKPCSIDGCKKFHHKLLHTSIQMKQKGDERIAQTTQNAAVVAHINHTQNVVLLKIAPVTIKSNGITLSIHALFDEAATVSLIDENIAEKLNIQGEVSNLNLKWTDTSSRKTFPSKKIDFEICGQDGQYYNMTNVYTMKDLDLPTQSFKIGTQKSKWHNLEAYIQDSLPEKPKLLIGQDHWDLIVSREVIEGPKNAPALSMTKLGWVIHGTIRTFKQKIDGTVLFIKSQENNDLDLIHEQVRKYFDLECYGMRKDDSESIENIKAEKLIEKVTRRVDDRWECGLLFKETDSQMCEHNSRKIAFERLKNIEKMKKDEKFAEQYENRIHEYLEKNYCRFLQEEEINEANFEKVWYIPHFAVTNENKPNKIRLVFDAAAKVDGKCLNDFLIKGPDLFNSLVKILWRFRQKNVAFAADIEEMFHRINIRDEDQHCQRFLWRDGDSYRNPDVYVMQVMIFGAVSSPFSAQYVKNRNALEFLNEFPGAVYAILNSHYMDDYLDSVATEKEAVLLVNQVIHIHQQGGFRIRGWISNSMQLLESIPEELKGDSDSTIPKKILGLKWTPADDVLQFPLNFNKIDKEILNGKKIPTKREILKTIMSIFDPVGLLGVFTVRSKIIMQEVWKCGIHWDERLSEDMKKKWFKWLNTLPSVGELKIPRNYMKNSDDYVIEQHVFCDASQQAIATVSYFRFHREEHKKVTIVTSKTQVVAMKQKTTISKLELQAAVYACRIAKKIQEEHTMKIERTYFRTDSKTVLCWIRNESKLYKTFVSNRIKEIQDHSLISQWRWVPSKLNVADDATRDDRELSTDINSRWFQGPEFLYLDKNEWPQENFDIPYEENKMEMNFTFLTIEEGIDFLPEIERFSRWVRLIRTTAYVFKFVKLYRRQIPNKNITVEELSEAEDHWCRKVQLDSFPEEYEMLKRQKSIPKSSKLYGLSCGMENQLIIIRGRTDFSPELMHSTKHPVILNGKHRYTKLLIKHYHEKNYHIGKETIINELRQKFWILKVRRVVNKIVFECNFCRMRRAKPDPPEMGQLPAFRLTKPPRAFTYVGMDYFGPMMVSIGRRTEKRYGVLFTCLSVRAIHIELAESLSADSCILAIRRFVARRGEPQIIMSDNGTNMKAAEKELKQAMKDMDNSFIREEMVGRNIDWKFIPPASPHMGGTWERMVRSVKEALKVTLKDKVTKLEILTTLLCEGENMVNSRPLTIVSSDPDDAESITPNHFLIGIFSSVKSPGYFHDDKIDISRRWRYSQKLADCFWHRWVKEYLPTLIRRTKWFQKKNAFEIGEMVVIMDNTSPRNNWPLGKIEKVFPGKDGQVRVVDVKTKTGVYRRPTAKLCRIGHLEEASDET